MEERASDLEAAASPSLGSEAEVHHCSVCVFYVVVVSFKVDPSGGSEAHINLLGLFSFLGFLCVSM